MDKYKNAIGIIKACGLNIKGSAELQEEAKRIESTIIDALEKQIPKKPKILTWKPLIDSGWEHGCPNCGCAVGVNKHLGFAYNEYLEPNEDYCCSCGQALDWSDTNDLKSVYGYG